MEIKNCIKEKEFVNKGSIHNALSTRTFTMPLLVFTVIFVVLGTCGNDTFVFYGPTIFSKIDVGIPTPVLSTLPWIGFSIGYASRLSIILANKAQARFLPLLLCIKIKINLNLIHSSIRFWFLVYSPLMAKMNRKPQYMMFASVMSASMFAFGAILKFVNEGII